MTRGTRCLAAIAAAMLVACQRGEAPPAAAGTPALPAASAPRLFDGLGGGSHPITTRSELAQRYFAESIGNINADDVTVTRPGGASPVGCKISFPPNASANSRIRATVRT